MIEPTLLLLLTIAAVAGMWAGIALGRRMGYEHGYATGHTRGVLDADPWTCSCGWPNKSNLVMCAHCGADREFPAEVNSETK